MKLRVEITPEDIENGVPSFGHSCPVALALRRALDAYPSYHGAEFSVGSAGIYVCHRGYPQPPEVAEFVQRFDTRQQVEPFTFELEI